MPLDNRDAFSLAVRNVARWGDTDVFPFPIENHILHDRPSDVVSLLEQIDADTRQALAVNPPLIESALSLVTYEGFRWVSQIDPVWNAYFLGLVLRIAPEIEQARIPETRRTVFSHRFNIDRENAALFSSHAWQEFVDRSDELAHEFDYVVTADIADFYGRLYHHRIENSLSDLSSDTKTVKGIVTLLKSFSGGTSYGLPVGGPAARLLSETALRRVDDLLTIKEIPFCRYADDYRLFAPSRQAAFRILRTLTETLLRHEGLTLQKNKTRVLRSKDYLRSPLFLPEDSDELTPAERRERKFLRLSLRYDPYSPNAEEDYDRLSNDLREFDILQMLSDEVAKSRVNVAVIRRLSQALRLLNRDIQNAAVDTILKSLEMLSPALPVVLRVLADVYPNLTSGVQESVAREIRGRITEEDYALTVPVNLAYALRVLRYERSNENIVLAARLFEGSAAFIQRDIVYLMYYWNVTSWISDRRRSGWSSQHHWVRRALLLTSYALGDEGSHWRRSITSSGLDKVARQWMDDRVKAGQTDLPL